MNIKKGIKITFIILILIITIKGAIADTYANQSLLRYYDMNTTSWIDSISGQNGTKQGGFITATGKIGNGGDAITVNTDWLSIPQIHLNDTDNWTITFWWKVDNMANYNRFFGNKTDSDNNFYQDPTGDEDFFFEGNANGGDAINDQVGGLTAGTWYWTALRHTNSDSYVTMFFNGTPIGNFTAQASNTIVINAIAAGHPSSSNMQGVIDEFAIYGESLNEANITLLYNNNTGCSVVVDYPTGCGGESLGGAPPPSTSFGITETLTYDTPVNENSNSSYKLNLNWSDASNTTNITFITKQSWYNNTNQTITTLYENLGIKGNTSYNISYITPTIITNSTTINFNFTYILENGTQDYTATISNTQTLLWRYLRLNITAYDWYNMTQLTNYNVTGNNGTQSSGSLNSTFYNTRLPLTSSDNITLQKGTYTSQTHYNISSNIQFNLSLSTSPLFYLYIYNQRGTQLISNSWYWDNQTQTAITTNPVTLNAYDYVNQTHQSIEIRENLSDLDLIHINYTGVRTWNQSLANQSINLTFNQLYLVFTSTINGTITQASSGIGRIFNGTSILIYPSNLTEGKVVVQFNTLNDSDNYTQFYEYYNTNSTYVNESLFVLDEWTYEMWFTVTDEGNRPLDGVTLTAKISNFTTGYTNFVKIGQRYTDKTGTSMFRLPLLNQVTLSVSKDGYETRHIPGNFLFWKNKDETTPLAISLSDTGTKQTYGISITVPSAYTYNKTNNITGYIGHAGSQKLTYTTAFNEKQGKQLTTPIEDAVFRDIYPFTLVSGTDFNTTDGNIVIKAYLDGVEVLNFTIRHITEGKRDALDSIQNVSENPGFLVIMVILTLLISGYVSYSNESTTAGVITFGLMSVVLTIISMKFMWILAMMGMYYGGRKVYEAYTTG